MGDNDRYPRESFVNICRFGRLARATTIVAALAVAAGCGDPSEAELLATAKRQLEKKDANAAVVQLKTAIQKNPQSAEARFLLGRTLFESGNPAAAAIELERALTLKFGDAAVLPLLAKALVTSGQAKKVVDQYGSITLPEPKATAELKSALAAAYVTLDQLDNCEAALKAALAADPRNTAARLQMARLTAGRQSPAEALDLVESLLRDEPRLREAWLLKAQLLWVSKRDTDGGRKAFEQAIAIDPQYAEAHVGLSSLLLQKQDLPGFRSSVAAMVKALPGRSETRYFEARVAMLDGNARGARDITQQLLKSAPKNVRVLQLAAQLELVEGSPLVAESHLKKVLELAPELTEARSLLAKTYLQAGEPNKALAILRPLVAAAEPKSGDLALTGEAHLLSGDPTRAEEFFKRALQMTPDAVNVRTALALTRIAKGNVEAGLGELESASTADRNSTSADLALISTLMRRNDVSAALKAVDRLQDKLPGKASPHHLRGQLLTQQRDLAGARKSFEQALSIDPNFYPATSALVALDMSEQNPDAARQRYQDLLAREPGNTRAMVALALLMRATGAKPAEVSALLDRAVQANPNDVPARVAQIDFFISQHDAKSATTAAQAGVAALPGDMALLDAQGRAQLASGNVQQAIVAFSKVAAAQPGSANAQIRLAEGFMAANDYDSAARPLRRALELAPDSVAARKALVMIAVSRKRFAEGLAMARQLQKDRPNESIGWQLQSDIHAVQRDWPGAIAAMRESLKRAPSSEAASRLVELFVAADRRADADAFVTTWQKDHPQDVRVVFQLAAVLLLHRDYPRAEARFREVLAVRADDALALNNVAWLMVQQNKPGAAAVAERALKAAPNQAQVMDTLALALAAEGDMAKAIDWQRKAMAQAPQDATYRLGLARLLIKSGDKTQAREELDKLSKLGPAFARQGEVSELLKRL